MAIEWEIATEPGDPEEEALYDRLLDAMIELSRKADRFEYWASGGQR
jgi:hypothetical protein